jgi:hypothetical protein
LRGHSRCLRGTHGIRRTSPDLGRSSSAPRDPQPSKLVMRVRSLRPLRCTGPGQGHDRRGSRPYRRHPGPGSCHTRTTRRRFHALGSPASGCPLPVRRSSAGPRGPGRQGGACGAAGAPVTGLCVGTPARHGRACRRYIPMISLALRAVMSRSSRHPRLRLSGSRPPCLERPSGPSHAIGSADSRPRHPLTWYWRLRGGRREVGPAWIMQPVVRRR